MTGEPEINPADARALAIRAHAGQTYGQALSYRVHLEAVEKVLADFGLVAPFWVACAWLHDTLEDTAVTRADIQREFGKHVADTVWMVTGTGANRKARQASILAKVCKDWPAAMLKTADRIANVEDAAVTSPRHAEVYLSERREFLRAVEHFIPAGMRNRLEDAYRRCQQ